MGNRTINLIVIHCSDSPDSLKEIGAADIREWHREQGWTDIGYHFVVKRDGETEDGRSLDVAGAHVKGHNLNSIGICWVGRKIPTWRQYRQLIRLTANLCKEYGLGATAVKGHKELSTKTCPNLNMETFRRAVERRLNG